MTNKCLHAFLFILHRFEWALTRELLKRESNILKTSICLLQVKSPFFVGLNPLSLTPFVILNNKILMKGYKDH